MRKQSPAQPIVPVQKTWFVETLREVDFSYGTVHDPDEVAGLIRKALRLLDEPVEVFGILALNTKNKVIGISEITRGTLNASLCHPREVFRYAILANAAAIIVFHNHPSGDCTPSSEDRAVMQRLREAGTLIGIELMDSLVIGEDRHYSFRAHEGW